MVLCVCQAIAPAGSTPRTPSAPEGAAATPAAPAAGGEQDVFDMGFVLNTKSTIDKDVRKAMKANLGQWVVASQLLREIDTSPSGSSGMSPEVQLLRVRVAVLEAVLPMESLQQAAEKHLEDAKGLSDAGRVAATAWLDSVKSRIKTHTEEREKAPMISPDPRERFLTTLAAEKATAGKDMAGAAEFDVLETADGLFNSLDVLMRDVSSDAKLRYAKFNFQPKLDVFERHGTWTKSTIKNVRSEKQSRERSAKSEGNKEAARVSATALGQAVPPRAQDAGQSDLSTPARPTGILNLDMQGQVAIEQLPAVGQVSSDEEPYMIVDSQGVKDMSQNRAVKMKVVLTTAAGS